MKAAMPPTYAFVTDCRRRDYATVDHVGCPECQGTKKVVRRTSNARGGSVYVRSADADAKRGETPGTRFYTHCGWCGGKIPNPRRGKRFCDSSCRGKHSHAAKESPEPKKALEGARRGRRRRDRDGIGTRLYVVGDELQLVRDLLTGKPADPGPARDRLAEKIPRALERIERRAAA